MGLLDGFIQKKERGIVADQLDTVAGEIQSGKWVAMSPQIKAYGEGLLWGGVLGALPVIEAATNGAQFTKATWVAAGAGFVAGVAAYLRKNPFNPFATTPPSPPTPPTA